MKDAHKVWIISMIYSVILAVVVLIIYNVDMATWAIIGCATAMFNYTVMLKSIHENEKKRMNIAISLVIRMVMYIAVILFVHAMTSKSFLSDFQLKPMIIVVLGFLSTKVGMLIFYLFPFKKEADIKLEKKGDDDSVE